MLGRVWQQRTVERGKFGVAEGGQRGEGRKVGKEASSIVVKVAVILIINKYIIIIFTIIIIIMIATIIKIK